MGDWTGSDLALAERVEEAARRFAPFCKPSLHWAFLVPSGEAEGMVVLPGALRGSVCRDGWRGIPVRSRVTGFLRHHPDADEDDAEHVVGEVVSACWMDGTDAVLGVLRFHDSDAGRLAYVAVEASWMLGARCIGLSLNGTTYNTTFGTLGGLARPPRRSRSSAVRPIRLRRR